MKQIRNHIYKFGNELRIQKEGGPMGLGLTGDVAECYMVHWDKEFLAKLEALGITPCIYERFKDDITIMLKSLEKGLKYDGTKLVMDVQKKELDEAKSDEEVTMEIVKTVANSVDPMIKFTVDYPSNYKDGRMPILDVKDQ